MGPYGYSLVTAGSGWKSHSVREPGNVIEDPSPTVAARTFMFTYSGRDASGDIDVGIAFSQTGEPGTWTDYASNPIVSLGEDPYIVKDGTTGKAYRDAQGLHLFCETKSAGLPDSQSGINHFYSSDGVTWTADAANPVITPGTGWEATDRTSPVVLWDGSQFVMLYEGRNFDTSQDGQIGVARKAAIGGTGWTFDAANPIVGYLPAWATDVIVPDDIYSTGSGWVLLAHGYDGSKWTMGRLFTTDSPATWDASSFTEMAGNPFDSTSEGQTMPATGSNAVRHEASGARFGWATFIEA